MSSVPAAEAKRQALTRFQDPTPAHINCGQAVLYYALLRMDEDPEQIIYARYFGGGITGMGEICGALNGAALALGARDFALLQRGAEEPPSAADGLKAIVREFAGKFGQCRCRDLTGYDLSSPAGMEAFKQSEARLRCGDYVSWACDRLDSLLEPAVETA